MMLLLRGARPSINRNLRNLQFVTAASLAFSHGANDAQKSMGILSGGWRIVRTLGFAIYKVRPLHALDSQLTSAALIFGASMMGAPVSTTHVVATSIMGIGASERPKAVRWAKARDIVTTWLITIPGAALMSSACYLVVRIFN